MSLTKINVNNTQVTGVDDNPTAGSENLVKSNGTDKTIFASKNNGYILNFENLRSNSSSDYTTIYICEHGKNINFVRGIKFKTSSTQSGNIYFYRCIIKNNLLLYKELLISFENNSADTIKEYYFDNPIQLTEFEYIGMTGNLKYSNSYDGSTTINFNGSIGGSGSLYNNFAIGYCLIGEEIQDETKDLFNINNGVGKYINLDGYIYDLLSQVSFSVTPYIRIDNIKTINGFILTDSSYYAIAYYDENYSFISGEKNSDFSYLKINRKLNNVPEDAKYVRFCRYNSSNGIIPNIELYSYDLVKELIKPDETLIGKYIVAGGEIAGSGSVTGFKSEVYKIYNPILTITGPQILFSEKAYYTIAFYDSDVSLTPEHCIGLYEHKANGIKEIKSPIGTKCVIFCTYNNNRVEILDIKENVSQNVLLSQQLFIDYVEGKYLNLNDEEVAITGCSISDYISVEGYAYIYPHLYIDALGYCLYYDSTKTKVGSFQVSQNNIDKILEIPSNASYVRLCSYTKEELFPGKPYAFLIKDIWDIRVIDIYKYHHLARKPFDFDGKFALWAGDSITVGYINGSTVIENGFPKLFSECVGLPYTKATNNIAVSGSTIAGSSQSSIANRIKAVQNYPDFLFIAGGTNDYNSGIAMSDFKLALEDLCDFINTNWPQTTQIIWITPIDRGPYNTHEIMDIQYYRNAITEIAMSKDIYKRFSVIQGNEFDFPKSDNLPMCSVMYGDGYHPSELGYKTLYLTGLLNALC